MKQNLTSGFSAFAIIMFSFSCNSPGSDEWRPLFDGESLSGWNIKISGFEMDDNHKNTFRVEDGLLKVSYDEYESFDNKFGHIFFNEPFSHFKLRVEYRFTGNQVPGGPGWAFRNNGIMFHCQSPESMGLKQDFPVSVEAQLLGGDGKGERPNFNVCTPGTNVMIDGKLRTEHCITSNAATYHGDDWVTVELHVYGDSIVHHIIENDTVLTYTGLRISESGQPLRSGYIALQAESHPAEFRKVEIMEIKK
jgi:hypothetical protein